MRIITFCIGLVLGVIVAEPILVRAQSLPKLVIGYPATWPTVASDSTSFD
jgi:hypothetical protein